MQTVMVVDKVVMVMFISLMELTLEHNNKRRMSLLQVIYDWLLPSRYYAKYQLPWVLLETFCLLDQSVIVG